MAFAARRPRLAPPAIQQPRSLSVCRVHSCARCGAAIDSPEPCSFTRTIVSVCQGCRVQEHVLRHLPVARATWGAALARTSRI